MNPGDQKIRWKVWLEKKTASIKWCLQGGQNLSRNKEKISLGPIFLEQSDFVYPLTIIPPSTFLVHCRRLLTENFVIDFQSSTFDISQKRRPFNFIFFMSWGHWEFGIKTSYVNWIVIFVWIKVFFYFKRWCL